MIFYLALLSLTLILGLGWQEGLALVLLFLAVCAFLISFDLLYLRTQADQVESQRLLTELQSAHQKLQEYAVQVEELAAAQEAVKSVYVSPAVKRYLVEMTRRTRSHSEVYLVASPRGSLALFRGGQTLAAIRGREFVLPDDIKALALPALAHRVIPGPAARLRDVTAERIVQEVVDQMPVPGGDLTGEDVF